MPIINIQHNTIYASNIYDWYFYAYYIEKLNDNSNNSKDYDVFRDYEIAILDGYNYSTQSFLITNINNIYSECWKLQSTLVLEMLEQFIDITYNLSNEVLLEISDYKLHIHNLIKQQYRHNIIVYYNEYQRSTCVKIKEWINAINSFNHNEIIYLVNNILHYSEIPCLTTRERMIIKSCIKDNKLPFHTRYSGMKGNYRTLHIEKSVIVKKHKPY